MRQISDRLFIETGLMGPNLGVIHTGEGTIVVDTPQRPTEALAWGRELAAEAPVKYIICTEHHPDHVTGVTFMPGRFIAHEEVRKALQSKDPSLTRAMVQRIDPPGVPLLETYQLKLPDITFSDRLALHIGDQAIELFPLPGHTSSGIGVYLPGEKAVFVGDVVFHKVKSFLQEAQPDRWFQSLETLGRLDVEVIIPGHGDEICDKSYLCEQRAIIQGWVETVSEAMRRGWSLEEARERISSTDPYPVSRGNSFTAKQVDEMCISRLYSVLKPAIS